MSKIFNDPIHGHIEISDICVKIIDTPQFQRLRDVAQLGGLYYVFSGASSNRFEHCLGVSHLAKLFAEKLRANQPELGITDVDILCVEIAGLIHDLGHGPFSHMFDMKFLKISNKYPEFEHEEASVGIFELLIEENNLTPHLRQNGIHEADVHFIKELIYGAKEEVPAGFKWRGRGNKTFLYHIVANKVNSIDVDKFDYFARDCKALGMSISFDCHRLMKFARVMWVNREDNCSNDESKSHDGQLEICFHIKEAWNLFELFHTRYALHKRAYQHKVSCAVETMICEAFVLADQFIFLSGRDGRPIRMSDTPSDMVAYYKASDYLFKQIEHSSDPQLKPARDLIRRISTRDLYSLAGESLLTPTYARKFKSIGTKMALNQIGDQLVSLVNDTNPTNNISASDIVPIFVKMGYGGKNGRNPVSELTTFFVPLKDPNGGDISSGSALLSPRPTNSQVSSQCRVVDRSGAMPPANTSMDDIESVTNAGYVVGVAPPDSVSRLLPREFEETYLRVYCKSKLHVPFVKVAYEVWCANQTETDSSNNSGSVPLSPSGTGCGSGNNASSSRSTTNTSANSPNASTVYGMGGIVPTTPIKSANKKRKSLDL